MHSIAIQRIIAGQAEAANPTTYILGPGGRFDVNGQADAMVLDADGDTTLSSPTDDQVDLEVGGADVVTITSTLFNLASGLDLKGIGASSDRYFQWDSSADTLMLYGPARPRGFNALSSRFELRWVAGQRGKPSLNADIASGTEATREIADPDFEILGTNASSDDSTFYAEGGIQIQTDGADGDEVIILPHLDANQTAWTQVTWGTDKETVWECHIKTAASIDNCIIWAGLKLTNTEVTATDAEQAFFRYENGVNTGKWQAVSSIGGTDDEADSGVTVAVTTEYHLKIVIGSDRTAKFYINGTLVETSAALTDATDLIPYIGVAADGAGEVKTLYVFGQAISRVIG